MKSRSGGGGMCKVVIGGFTLWKDLSKVKNLDTDNITYTLYTEDVTPLGTKHDRSNRSKQEEQAARGCHTTGHKA